MEKKGVLSAVVLSLFFLIAPMSVTAAPSPDSTPVYTPDSSYLAVAHLASSATAIPECAGFFGVPPPLTCYSPQFLKAAYDFPSNLDGTGQTILIVDSYGSPTIQSDLATFDALFGLPAPPSFTIYCPSGCPSPSLHANDTKNGPLGWALETSLDVEYAHAMAPGANIVLVVAPSAHGDSVNNAEAAAIAKYPGSIMSQSFGTPECSIQGNKAQQQQAEQNYQNAVKEDITVFASAGDSGATNGGTPGPSCTNAGANAGFPASSPLVTAVGGTMGDPYPSGLVTYTTTLCSSCIIPSYTPTGYGGEQVWNEPAAFSTPSAGGGAPSDLFPVPSYQSGLGLSSRTIPDVSYNAAGNGGVLVVDDACLSCYGFTTGPIIFLVGGTSAGSPQWAAIAALADQEAGHPLGFLNPAIYAIGNDPTTYAKDFHDITVGNNILSGSSIGFSAKAGWDDATGWGTPNVANLIPDLISPP